MISDISATAVLVGVSANADWLVIGETVVPIARALGATVTLVSVDDGHPETELRKREGANTLLHWYREQDVDASVTWERGGAVGELVRATEPSEVVLLAIGGAGDPPRWGDFIGDTVLRLLRRVQRPLLVVPRRTRRPRATGHWRLVYPVDFSETSMAGLAEVCGLADALDAVLEIVHAIETRTERDARATPKAVSPGKLLHAQARLAALPISTRRPAGRHATICASLAAGIVDFADRVAGDLIVVASHGRGRVGSLLLGSVTEDLVRLADRPVLVLKPSSMSEPDAPRFSLPAYVQS